MALSVFVLTGAGLSADSGLPTYRDGGLWDGHRFEDLATPAAWRRDPQLVWRFYQERRARLVTAEPNAAHLALARLGAQLGPSAFTLVTQNVDDLHPRAGSAALAMHGSLMRLRCERCARTVEDRTSLDPERFVPCAGCGHARLRPDVVWFGELPYGMRAIEKALFRCTHFLSLGTSGVVQPAAGFLAVARARGAQTIVQSLAAPENLAPADEFHAGRAAEVLPPLLERLGRIFTLGRSAPESGA